MTDEINTARSGPVTREMPSIPVILKWKYYAVLSNKGFQLYKGWAQLQLHCKDKGFAFLPPYNVVSEKSTSSQASTIQPFCAWKTERRPSTAVEFLWMDASFRFNHPTSYVCATREKARRFTLFQELLKPNFLSFLKERKKCNLN